MRTLRGGMTWILAVGVMVSMLVPAPQVAQAQAPGEAPKPITAVVRDPRLPGDHRAEQEYFNGRRLAPPGVSPAQARLAALQQAQRLPQTTTVPAAIAGAGPVVGGPQPRGSVAPAGVWQQLGPAPENSDAANPSNAYRFGIVSGRATALAIGPNTGIIYLGTAGGGVWKSVNDGESWTPLTDFQPSLAIGSLALDPTDTTDRTLYAGTGEANFSGDAYGGVGIYKTTDGGANWTLQGASTFGPYGAAAKRIGAMAVSGSLVFAATTTIAIVANTAVVLGGLYRSADGGATWSQATVATMDLNAPITDVIIDGTTVYTVVSSAFSFYAYAGVYKSTTSGTSESFSPINTGLPSATTWHRAQLALARSNTQVLYIVIAKAAGDTLLGVYKTTNGGANWAVTAGTPPDFFSFGEPDPGGGPEDPPDIKDAGQGWYDIYITVDPTNENYVYSGGISMVGSANGGTTWSKIADVYCSGGFPCRGPIHPDQHAGAFGRTSSGSPRPFYAAGDGGIYKTTNPTVAMPTWASRNANLATTQFYAADTTANYLTSPIVVAGAQDNGTSRTASNGVGTWNAILGGDGTFPGIDRGNTNHVYAQSQNGSLYSTANATAGMATAWTSITPSTSLGCRQYYNLFVNPILVNPADGNSLMYAGYGAVCKSFNGGASWVSESVVFDYIRSLAMEPGNPDTRYVGQTNGVYRTVNGNIAGASTWAACGTGLPASNTNRVIGLTAATGGVVYATLSGFGGSHVWKSTNCGAWSNVSGDLPDVPTTSLVQYATNGGGTALIVSTDVGIFLSTNGGTTWATFGSGMPNTPVDQIITDGALTTLLAVTHGRGIWRLDIPGDFTATGLGSTSGTASGGSDVAIRGTGFTAGMSVAFGGTAATNIRVISGTELRVTSPAHIPGAVTVSVTLGVTTLNVPGTYTYGAVNPAPTAHATPVPTATSTPPPAGTRPRPTANGDVNTPMPQPMRR